MSSQFYDDAKSGVDVFDLVSAHHTTKMKTRNWVVNALAFLLSRVRTNTKTIFYVCISHI